MNTAVSIEAVFLESPTKTRYNHGHYPCNGLYFTPSGKKPDTAIIASHYTASFTSHYLAEYMASRGYGFLGWDTRCSRAQVATGFTLENVLIDIGVGIRWLREQAGIKNVVILGNSGGASLMGAYQSQAIHPHIIANAAPEEELSNLLPGDFYISLAAHPGRANVLTEWLDPSVTDENDPLSRDPSLDMYNPENGPPFSQEFIDRYRAAQVARNERITERAEQALAYIREGRPQGGSQLSGTGSFGVPTKEGVFDCFFSVSRQFADLRFTDLQIDPSKRPAGCYMGDPLQSNYSGYGLAPVTSAREWLSMWSLSRTQVRIDKQLPHVTQPALVISANHDQGCFHSHAQAIYEALGATDKTLSYIDGDHYIEQFGDRNELADLIANWLEDRGATPV